MLPTHEDLAAHKRIKRDGVEKVCRGTLSVVRTSWMGCGEHTSLCRSSAEENNSRKSWGKVYLPDSLVINLGCSSLYW